MAFFGPLNQFERELERKHCEDRLAEDFPRLFEMAPEHHRAEIDRLWHLVREAARGS